MSKLTLALLFFASACGGKQSPPSEPAGPPTPTVPTALTPEECIAQGGQVKGDIGDGKVACNEGDRDLGRVNQGIEGAVCCAPPAAP